MTIGTPNEHPQVDNAPAADEGRLDEIVDRFIEYDVGRLQGRAGTKAKHDFDALRAGAIPALVRGLNKAARIRASCPVMVISQKLQSALSANRDRSLLDYAVDNLGRDVPTSAPYAAHVRNLREQWAAVVGRSPTAEGARLVRELEEVKGHRLDAALAVVDARERFNDVDRRQLGWVLAAHLKSRDTKLRNTARQALLALSHGDDFGPAETARPNEVQQAICAWRRHFDAERFDSSAQGVLDSGIKFEEGEQRGAAIRCYRRVLTEYAGSPAAEEAKWLIDALKPSRRP